jgi:hypothetical protein
MDILFRKHLGKAKGAHQNVHMWMAVRVEGKIEQKISSMNLLLSMSLVVD